MAKNWDQDKRNKWWYEVIGYVPEPYHLKDVAKEEPGLMILIENIFKPKLFWERQQKEYEKKKDPPPEKIVGESCPFAKGWNGKDGKEETWDE